MGVYIPNMEKPKDCKECQWHLEFYIEDEQVGGLCTITEKDDKENTCPLIEIPTPHGRLIDKDELLSHLKKDPLFDLVERYGVSGVIESRPTILEAEE